MPRYRENRLRGVRVRSSEGKRRGGVEAISLNRRRVGRAGPRAHAPCIGRPRVQHRVRGERPCVLRRSVREGAEDGES